MGLDTTHGCWHGSYSAFGRWREKIASVSIAIPLRNMQGFCGTGGIDWNTLKPDIIHVLLNHSDCDGIIEWKDCKPLAERLEQLLPVLDGDGGGHIGPYREKTQEFIDGLMRAHEAHEDVEFR